MIDRSSEGEKTKVLINYGCFDQLQEYFEDSTELDIDHSTLSVQNYLSKTFKKNDSARASQQWTNIKAISCFKTFSDR